MVEVTINDTRFRDSISRLAEKCDNLILPLTLISQSWYKSNKAIFSLKGPGKYADLSPKYKKFKEKHLGDAYPILRLSGQLEDSITEPGAEYSISKIINKNSLILGSSVPWGKYHQSPAARKIMPFRPFILLGSEQTAPGVLNQRVTNWIKLLENHVKAQAKNR